MEIIRRYHLEATDAWYAVVRLDDGNAVELKIQSDAPPGDADFLNLAAEYMRRLEETANPEPTITVEAEDGTAV